MAVYDIINNKKVMYYDGPKCGSSTILAYANLIHNPELMSEVNELLKQGVDPTTAYNKCWRPKKDIYSREKIIKRLIVENEKVPKDSIKFCIVRDPIERFISVYKALILTGWYVTSKDASVDEFIRIIDLDKTILPNWAQVISNGWKTVQFHFTPQVQFYGIDPSIFTHIYNIDQMDDVRKMLEIQSNMTLPSLKVNSTKKIDIQLTESQISWIKKRYARDYKFYGKWMEKR